MTFAKFLEPTIQRLHASGIRVSLFIEPSREQIDAAVELGAEIVELHTGAFANTLGVEQRRNCSGCGKLRVCARAAGCR